MRRLALLMLFALMGVLLPATTAGAAALTCNGKAATIVGVPAGPGQRTIINGTPGNDVIIGTSGRDVIRAGDGHDTICAGTGRDVVYGERGRDYIRGEGGIDRLVGGTGIDKVYGGGGNDVLKGGYGEDHIVGGIGTDQCYDELTHHACEWVNDAPPTDPPPPLLNEIDPNAPVSNAIWVEAMEDELLRLMNVERANVGVAPMVENASMSAGSRVWSATLANSSQFYHDPSIAGIYGENIAQNYWLGSKTINTARTHAAEMMNQWMNSPGHRANILDHRYEEMGVGVALSGVLTYGTQRFSF